MTVVARMMYVQAWKGSYRFRRPVPPHVKVVIGKKVWLHTLGTSDKGEANRRVIAHIERTNRLIHDVETGNWPPIDDARLYDIARQWWQWVEESYASLRNLSVRLVSSLSFDARGLAFAGNAELAASVRRFIGEHGLTIPPAASLRLKRDCEIFHHERTGGYRGESDARRAAINKVLDTIDNLDIDPRQIANAIDGNRPTPAAVRSAKAPAGSFAALPTSAVALSQSILPPYKFDDLITDWAAENRKKGKTPYSWRKMMGKLATHLGHDDATLVTEADLIGWKTALNSSRLSVRTVRNYLTMVKTLFNFAVGNKRIAVNPAKDVKYTAKPSTRGKRLSYSDDDAKLILEAARLEKAADRRWVPWIEAFTGARLEEVCGANVADIEIIDGVTCLHIWEDNRDDDATIKTENSARLVPLHPAIIAEGFLDYVKELPKNGPLFPKLKRDTFGRRGGNGSKRIGRWVREKVGITDPRKAPNHSWRHRFKTSCRKAGIAEEIHDYVSGHATGKIGRDYGEYPAEVLENISKIPSPFTG
jgi:integrase